MAIKNYPNTDVVNVNTFNSCVPKNGARCVPVPFDFTVESEWLFDYERMRQRDFLSFCQTIYIDNADNAVPCEIVIDQTRQRIIAPANSQGYYVVAMSSIRFVIISEGGGLVSVLLFNVPIPGNVWSTA